MKVKSDWLGKKYTIIAEDKLDGEALQTLNKYVEKLEEEIRKLKLHIEAKDKAYTVLLKDYEKIKEDRDKMKAEIEQRLNAIRDLHVRY